MPPAENNEVPKSGYNLPPPIHEAGAESDDTSSESAPASPEVASNPKGPKSSKSKTQIIDFHLKDFASPKPKSAVASTTIDDNPQIADDQDLIEKEWVAKAKKIIEDNREDPSNQSKEMTIFKADYMQKRYNKVIKVSE